MGGEIRDRVAIAYGMVFAYVLGGADRRTLMICAGVTHDLDHAMELVWGSDDICAYAGWPADKPLL